MKLVIQRVKNASVKVDEKIVGEIEKGFLVLIGIKQGDTKQQADYLVKKVINLIDEPIIKRKLYSFQKTEMLYASMKALWKHIGKHE